MPKPDNFPHVALGLNARLEEQKNPETGDLLAKRIRKIGLIKEDGISRLEKYEELDKNHPLNRPFTGNPSFRGPVFKRKYTNLACIFIFIIFNILFVLYGLIAYKDGAAGRLTRGNDFRAEICGLDKLEDKKYLYYLDPAKDLNVRMCVESCPSTSGQQICLYDVDPKVLTPFCYQQTATVTSGRFCLPNEPINKGIVDAELSELTNMIKRIAGDLGAGMDMIVVGLILSLLIAAVFLRTLFNPKRIKYVIWSSIWGTVFAILIMAFFLYKEYEQTIEVRCILGKDKRGCGGFKASMFKNACFGFIIFAVLYLLLIMKIFNKINLGVGLLQATTKCATILSQMKFLSWALSAVLSLVSAFFFIGTIYGFSVGAIVVVSTKNIDGGFSKVIQYDSTMRYLIGFNFFMYQWWLNVVLLVSDSVVAYAISIWFFEKRKETVILPITRIFKDVLKYHLGTLIMLGLFKIIFRPARLFLRIFTSVMRKPKQNRNVVRFLQACCLCCIHTYERSLRYQSKHAIVQMIMWSESFKTSSKRAWFLLFRHKHKITNMDSLVTFILFLTKVVCSLFGGLFVYVFLSLVPRTITGTKTDEIETPLGPTFIVFYIGFFYSSVFQSVLDIATKTVLQCFLMDSEMFVGEQRFAEKKVLDFMEFFKEEGAPEERFGQLAQYVKGMKATFDANIPVADEDPDEEENRKFEIQIPKDSDESSEEEEEEEHINKDEDEDSEEESEEESSEEESDEERPAILKGSVFGSGANENHNKDEESPNFGKSIATVTSLHSSPIQIKSHHTSHNNSHISLSQNNSQVSLMKSSGLSFFGREHDQEKSKEKSRERTKEEEKRKKAEEDKEDEEEESEEEDDEEEESEEDSQEASKDQTTKLFGGWQGQDPAQKKGHMPWKPLEMSALSHNLSTTKGLLKLNGSDTNLYLQDASLVSNNTRIIEKANLANNTMRSDKHNIFNKSKIAENTTMRLEYDDDDEANLKYRL